MKPLLVGRPLNFEAISSPAIDAGGSQSADRFEIADVYAVSDELVSDVEHDNLADEERIGSERQRLEQLAFETRLGRGDPGRLDADGPLGKEPDGRQLAS